MRNVLSRQILRKLASAVNAGQTSFFTKISPLRSTGWVSWYRLLVFYYIVPVLGRYCVWWGQVCGRCVENAVPKPKHISKSFSSPNKACRALFCDKEISELVLLLFCAFFPATSPSLFCSSVPYSMLSKPHATCKPSLESLQAIMQAIAHIVYTAGPCPLALVTPLS